MSISLLLLSTLIGCGGKIKTLYQDQRSMILAAPAELQDNWQPDMRLRISYEVINTLGKQNLQKALEKGSFDVSFLGNLLQLKTTNTIQNFVIQNADGDNRFQFKAKVNGTISCNTQLLKFSIPYTGELNGTAGLSYKKGTFSAKIDNLNELSIGLQKQGQLNVIRPLKKWIRLPKHQIGKL